MESMSYSSLRTHLAGTLDKVNEDHRPVLITRKNGMSAVLLSLDDFNAYEETAYLMSNPSNAIRLQQSIGQVEGGHTQQHTLIEE